MVYPIAKILYGRAKNWIICERGFDAQDNGYFFFKYLKDMHPEINPIFLIKRNSPDFGKVSKLGKVAAYGSLKHFVLVIGCPVKISTHLFGYAPWIQMSLYFRRHKTHDVHVFLQHGIIKNEHEGLHGDVCKSLNLFVCGAKPEYEFVKKTFDYEQQIPKYTGLPRFDNLLNFKTKKQILFMPTWRRDLVDLSEDQFVKTDFYKNWDALLKSKKISQKCLETNITIKFYLHSSLQKYSSLFTNSNIAEIIHFGDEPVQTLLKESKLLVTDYSSVYFDFAYMGKPTVYFQFDEGTFNQVHYSKGYFDYHKNGFGNVCKSETQAIDEIIKIIENNFSIDNKFCDRINDYFVYRDTNNCDRVFLAISSIL